MSPIIISQAKTVHPHSAFFAFNNIIYSSFHAVLLWSWRTIRTYVNIAIWMEMDFCKPYVLLLTVALSLTYHTSMCINGSQKSTSFASLLSPKDSSIWILRENNSTFFKKNLCWWFPCINLPVRKTSEINVSFLLNLNILDHGPSHVGVWFLIPLLQTCTDLFYTHILPRRKKNQLGQHK